MSMPLSEHGVTVHFPDNNYFQFGGCNAYNGLGGHGVKEMDICWLDKANNVLWAVELKAFDNPANAKHIKNDLKTIDIVEYWINELYKKTVHTLCMLETNRSNTKSCLVAGISDTTIFKIVHLINVIPGQESYLTFMKDELTVRLKPLLAIFRVDSLAVVPYNTAKGGALVSWIV